MSQDFHAEAAKLINAHNGGVAMADPTTIQSTGFLALLLQLLSGSGINFGKILAFAATTVPMFLVRPINWTGIFAAALQFFQSNPLPAPTPPAGNDSIKLS